jgi:hypothetical protein
VAFSTGQNGTSALSTSTDVALNAPVAGQTLGYNSATAKWQNNPRPPQLVETVNIVAAAGASETLPDVTAATMHIVTLTSNCVFTFPALGAGKSFMLVLVQDATGGRTVTWPATVKWQGGVSPVLSAGATKEDFFSFICVNGTKWHGFESGLGF